MPRSNLVYPAATGRNPPRARPMPRLMVEADCSLIDSAVPIIVHHAGLDSPQAANALLSTMVFAGDGEISREHRGPCSGRDAALEFQGD